MFIKGSIFRMHIYESPAFCWPRIRWFRVGTAVRRVLSGDRHQRQERRSRDFELIATLSVEMRIQLAPQGGGLGG